MAICFRHIAIHYLQPDSGAGTQVRRSLVQWLVAYWKCGVLLRERRVSVFSDARAHREAPQNVRNAVVLGANDRLGCRRDAHLRRAGYEA